MEESEKWIRLEDAVAIALTVLKDYEYGYSVDALAARVKRFMEDKSVSGVIDEDYFEDDFEDEEYDEEYNSNISGIKGVAEL